MTSWHPVANSQGRNLGHSVCLVELPVCLAQKGDLGECGKGFVELGDGVDDVSFWCRDGACVDFGY